jgi:hypothetical protein
MEQKLDFFKIWPPDFAQKNICCILKPHVTKFHQNIFFVKIPIFEKTCFVSKFAYDFFFNITIDQNNQNTSIISFWKGL